jgi:ABC-type transport system involved in cytochrome c biogenesis permease subunit
LALLGTYAIVRGALVKSAGMQFRDRFLAHCKFLLAAVAVGCAAGTLLGGFWAEREWGRFWSWGLKEQGALVVIICALVLFLLVTRLNLTNVHLGQASLIMSLVTFDAWFVPACYLNDVGPLALALLAVALFVQLSILSISFVLPKRCLTDR